MPTHRASLLLTAALLGGWPCVSPAAHVTEKSRTAFDLAKRPGPSVAAPVRTSAARRPDPFPWKRRIVTTVFWIGEQPTKHNPVPNDKSSWDTRWVHNYGGYDDPDPAGRRGYIPAAFVPRQNPFYVALPYNDVGGGRTKPEAAKVIPWFEDTFVRPGESVCKSRWIAIHYRGRIAYAQWEDVGPFRTDHWEYVFGDARPAPNRNGGAGLDISPAVRDYLGMKGKDVADWKFVEVSQVPPGPWRRHGDNNDFVNIRRRAAVILAADTRAGSSAAHID
ncbi:MAG: hypothetical protein ACO3J2_09405 [Chthoniobacterales bacterium]